MKVKKSFTQLLVDYINDKLTEKERKTVIKTLELMGYEQKEG